MKYQVQQRLFHLEGEFWIQDEAGNSPYRVDGRMFSSHLDLLDSSGNLLTRLHRKMFSLGDTMEIHDGSDQVIATVRPAFFSPIRHRYEVVLADGSQLEAVGEFSDRNWVLNGSNGQPVGAVSRQWAWLRDCYGVEVMPGADAPLVISIAICMDRIYEDEAHRA